MEDLGVMLALLVYAFGLPWALRRPHPEDEGIDTGQSLSDRQWREEIQRRKGNDNNTTAVG